MSHNISTGKEKDELGVHQIQSSDFDSANAKVSLSAGIEGEKKYSPPFGTTHSCGKGSSVV